MKLYPYQVEGKNRLLHDGRLILADEMGLGKTVQVLAAIQERELCALIICPKTVATVWAYHAKMFNLSYAIVEGSRDERTRIIEDSRKRDITIINYELVHTGTDESPRHALDLMRQKFDVIVVDEAHRIKTRPKRRKDGTQKGKTVAVILKLTVKWKCPLVWLLTGTPLDLEPKDAFVLLHVIDKAKWSSAWKFYRLYCELEDDGWGTKVSGCKNPELLAHDIEPYVLRREKKDVAKQLPPKIYNLIPLALHPEQEKLYWKTKKATKSLHNLSMDERWQFADANFMDLRRLCLDPVLIHTGYKHKSPKAEWLLDFIQDVGSDRIVLFSFFASWIKRLYILLRDSKFMPGMVVGGQGFNERQEELDAFERGDTQVLLTSIRAGGVGLNLQHARHVVFTDLDYNPSVNEQAEDRLHRIGISVSPNVYHLVHPGTIDQGIYNLVQERRDVNKYIMDRLAKDTDLDVFVGGGV